MLLLLSRPHIHPNREYLGMLARPRSSNKPQHAIEQGLVWTCDNSAFSGFNEGQYMNMLNAYRNLESPLWVTLPDVVGDAKETMQLFREWRGIVSGFGYPLALVAQDGLEHMPIPWNGFDCLFIGGTTQFKLGQSCRDIVAESKRRGKLTHMGRVNSARRIRYAQSIGCDSVDGSSYDRIPSKVKKHLPIFETTQLSFIENDQ